MNEPGRAVSRFYVPICTAVLVVLLSIALARLARSTQVHAEPRIPHAGCGTAQTPDEVARLRAVMDPKLADGSAASELLLVGNSQTIAVPYYNPCDLNTPEWLQYFLLRQSPNAVDVRVGSQGGMIAEEVLATVLKWGSLPHRNPQLVLAVQMDEFTETGMREDLRRDLRSVAVRQNVDKLVHNDPDLSAATGVLEKIADSSNATVAANTLPWPDRLEERVQTDLLGDFPAMDERDTLHSIAFLEYVKLRNRVLHLDQVFPKPYNSAAYNANLQMFELALRFARAHGIRTYIYMGPFRSTTWANAHRPTTDFQQLRRDLAALAARYQLPFLDLSGAVPEQDWTPYADNEQNRIAGVSGLPDLAHLREPAHKLVAERLMDAWGHDFLAASHP